MAGKKLSDYRAKRDFARTPEPAGKPAGGGAGGSARFVVQRHRARRLHYDLRFEIGGVLVSWAVPKGPTLDPGVKRSAVHVEDHPIEYLDFEGVIPAGEYGGGDVIVWDRGTWEPHGTDDPAAAVAAGELHADMHGEKLRGRLVLVRRGDDRSGRQQWLLLHKHDEYAKQGWDPEDHPTSVLSGRTNEQVKADPERMWRSGAPPSEASVPLRQTETAPRRKPRRAGSGNRRRAGSGNQRRAEPEDGERATTGDHPRASSRRDRRATARDLGHAETGQHALASPREQVPPVDDEALAALDSLGTAGTWVVFGRRLRVTNLDKVMFPGREREKPVTKRDLLRYAATIAPVVLPYLAGRPLNMHRFPGGVGTKGFWHKQLPGHAPDWVPRWDNPEADRGETTTYLLVDEPAALVWAANFAALEWHAWTSRADEPHCPSYALIDIDPGPATGWDDVLLLARLHRTALDHLGVRGQPKVTGRRGIQVWIPVVRGPGFDQTRDWVEQLSRAIGAVVPDRVSWRWDVHERGGRARLDYTQNAVGKTLVAPYSPRAAAGAPVSAPIAWEELDDPSLRPDGFTIRAMPERLATYGDLFRPVLTADQNLPPIH